MNCMMRLIRETPDWMTHRESKKKETNEHSSNARQVIESADRGGDLQTQSTGMNEFGKLSTASSQRAIDGRQFSRKMKAHKP